MSDWIGLISIILILCGIYFGLKHLNKPKSLIEPDFEKRVYDSAQLLSAGINALNENLNPSDAKGKIGIEEVKKGRYNKKEKEEKSEQL